MKDSSGKTAPIGVTNTSQGDWNVYQSQFMNYSSSFNGYAWGGSTGTPAPDTSPRPRVCAAANISQILT